MKPDRNKIIATTCLLAALFWIASCGSSSQQGPAGGQQAQSYPVLELQPRSIELTNSYPATLEGVQTVEIRPRVQGYIVAMPVDEGDIVEEGQTLFKLNSEQFEQEVRSGKADVEAAKAAVSTAEDEVQRYEQLVEKDIVSDYQLQSARNTLQSRKAALAQAEAVLENARVNLEYTTIKSPTDGVIGSIPYRIGSLVSSTIGQPMTVISDISSVYAYFSMSERELLEIAQNVAVEGGNRTLQQRISEMPAVHLRLADNTMYSQQGALKLASGLISTQTGSATMRAVFPNPQEILRSGGSANVLIPYQQDDAIVIPKSATYEIQNKRFAYAVTDSNRIESTEITTRPLSTKQLFIVEEGLAAGDKIVTAGMNSMQDGMTITPQPVDNDSLYHALSAQDTP